MKKVLFILIVLLGSGILIALSFSRWGTPKTQDHSAGIDFSPGEKKYAWNAPLRKFDSISLSESEKPETVYYRALSPVDGIYYRSWDANALSFSKKGGKTIIKTGSGIYVYNLQSFPDTYEIQMPHLTIVPKESGVFLIDTLGSDPMVFSVDAFLGISLVEWSRRNRVTAFVLFPSLRFVHTLANLSSLRGADILRISLLDSIRHSPLRTTEDIKTIFSQDDHSFGTEVFSIAKEDIAVRKNTLSNILTTVKDFDFDKADVPDAALPGIEQWLFVNDSKKEVALKNDLVKNIVTLIKSPSSLSAARNIENILAEMKMQRSELYDTGLSILAQYHALAIYTRLGAISDARLAVPSTFLPLARKIIHPELEKPLPYYSDISRVFHFSAFSDLSEQSIGEYLENALARTIDAKILAKDDFLPFTFFLTEYLSRSGVIPNTDTMKILSRMLSVSDDYYLANRQNTDKVATVTSTIFYSYNRIYSRLYQAMLDTYIDTTPKGMLLKETYLDKETPLISEDFVKALKNILIQARSSVAEKKSHLANTANVRMDPSVNDNHAIIIGTLWRFGILETMFGNYPKYLSVFRLNEENRRARGILVQQDTEMSRESLSKYLSSFSGVDMGSLKVLNDYKKDGFYEVNISIGGKAFSFRFWDSGHTIADVSYIDESGKKNAFPNVIIALDDKSEQMAELSKGEVNPEKKLQYDFRNFFEVTFIKKSENSAPIASGTSEVGSSKVSSMSSELELFIQKELLDKDFRNIKSFFPILFGNIQASITDGNYAIDLSGIPKSFPGNKQSYSLVFSSKYIFHAHTFSRLAFQVKKEEGEGYDFASTEIQILPARIPLLLLPDLMQNLGYYVDVIRSQYTGQKNIIIDLSGKRVILDDVSSVPTFPINN